MALQAVQRQAAIPSPVRSLPRVAAGDTASADRSLPTDHVAISQGQGRAPAALNALALETRISQATGTTATQGNRMDLLIDGNKAYPAMLDLIDGATTSLNMEMFIFSDDTASWDVAEALAAAAQRGVKVRLVTDWIGGFFGNPTTSPIYDFLRANGVEVRHFTPDLLHRPTQADHRKIVVADGTQAMTGGMNIGDEYRSQWHDVMVQVEGPVVGDLQRRFVDTWQTTGGTITDQAMLFPPSATNRAGSTTMRVLTTQPAESIRQGLFAAIDSAHDRINLEVPYFTDDDLVAHLIAAAKRGVDVHVIVPAESNHAIVDTAARHHAQALLDAGVHVHRFEGRMTHTKAASVDGMWGTLGSCNGDNLSLRVNREMNVTFSDPATVAQVDQELFAADIASSRPLQPQTMSWSERLATWAARLLNDTL